MQRYGPYAIGNHRRGKRPDSTQSNNRLRTKQSGAKRMGSGVERAGHIGLAPLRFRESSPEGEPGMGAAEQLAVAPSGWSSLSMSCMKSSVFESAARASTRPCPRTLAGLRYLLKLKTGARRKQRRCSQRPHTTRSESNAGLPADRSCDQPALQQRIVRPLSRAEDMQGGYGATMNVLP